MIQPWPAFLLPAGTFWKSVKWTQDFSCSKHTSVERVLVIDPWCLLPWSLARPLFSSVKQGWRLQIYPLCVVEFICKRSLSLHCLAPYTNFEECKKQRPSSLSTLSIFLVLSTCPLISFFHILNDFHGYFCRWILPCIPPGKLVKPINS